MTKAGSTSISSLAARLELEYQRLLARLTVGHPQSAALLQNYVVAQGNWPEGRSYNSVSPEVDRRVAETIAILGEPAFLEFHRVALIACARNTRPKLASHTRWAFSLPLWDEATAKLLDTIEERPIDSLDYASDLFCKDIALASGRVWHAGAQFVEPRMGFSRRALLEGGISTLRDGLVTLARLGGNFPMYEIHTAAQCLPYFSADGWTRCYEQIAKSMREDPTVRGVFGTAWFFDPALKHISPNLAYLYDFPKAHGAKFLKVSNTASSNGSALAKSGTRRRLYDEGKYRPQQYLMLWHRSDMRTLY